MNSIEVITKLREYNLWRRGDENIKQPAPFEIGCCIDEICEIAERLESERDAARQLLLEKGTISDLLKKIERLEKQIEGSNNFANERFEEIQRVRRERDEARHEIEGWRNKWECAIEMAARAENERDEAKNRMADALQELDLRTLDFERMRAERDEALENRGIPL